MRGLSTSARKTIQWTLTATRMSIEKMEVQQAELHDNLRRCNDFIASYEMASGPTTPWNVQMPLSSPFPCTNYSPVAQTPWTSSMGSGGQQPQYWDLSMLSEPRHPSPYASPADSGYYEPATNTQPFDLSDDNYDPDHVYSHERLAAAGTYTSDVEVMPVDNRSSSEQDDVSDSQIDATMLGAEISTSRTWRHSAMVLPTADDGLATTLLHRRGVSVGSELNYRRRMSDLDTDEH